MAISKKIMKRFKSLSKLNDSMIRTYDSVAPMCFILTKKDECIAIQMQFRNGDEKIHMRNKMKSMISQQETVAYFLFQDSIMTMLNPQTNESEAKDVVVRSIYTPTDKYLELVFYKDKKIIEKKVVPQSQVKNFQSEWNIWETTEITGYDNKQYEEIKKANPERYKDVA